MARKSWLDETGQTTQIDEYAQRLAPLVDALADGRVDRQEVDRQEERLVALMKQVEPRLSDELHAQVTQLLCELSAFNYMQVLHDLSQSRPATRFQG
jgi:hypothetical protein